MALVPAARWYWQDDSSPPKFQAYDAEQSAQLEAAFENGAIEALFFGNKYKINFPARKQTNVHTNFTRQVIRGTWFWHGDGQDFVPYTEHVSQALERAFSAGQFINFQIQVDAERYVMLSPDGRHLQFRFNAPGRAGRPVTRGFHGQLVPMGAQMGAPMITEVVQQPIVTQQVMQMPMQTTVTPVSVGQPMMGMGQPAMGQPMMGQPMGQPQFGQPMMGQPMGQPSMGQPSMGQPMMGQPMLGQPMGQPAMGQPMGQPSMGQPMGQPAMGQPMSQPGMGQQYPPTGTALVHKTLLNYNCSNSFLIGPAYSAAPTTAGGYMPQMGGNPGIISPGPSQFGSNPSFQTQPYAQQPASVNPQMTYMSQQNLTPGSSPMTDRRLSGGMYDLPRPATLQNMNPQQQPYQPQMQPQPQPTSQPQYSPQSLPTSQPQQGLPTGFPPGFGSQTSQPAPANSYGSSSTTQSQYSQSMASSSVSASGIPATGMPPGFPPTSTQFPGQGLPPQSSTPSYVHAAPTPTGSPYTSAPLSGATASSGGYPSASPASSGGYPPASSPASSGGYPQASSPANSGGYPPSSPATGAASGSAYPTGYPPGFNPQ